MIGKILGVLLALIYVYLAQSTLIALKPAENGRVKAASVTVDHSFEVAKDTPDSNQILALVNKGRVERGLAPLEPNQGLAAIAQIRARDMAANGYYAHLSPAGTYYFDVMEDHGMSASYSCENLDLQFVTDPGTYVNDWLQSDKGHRECLLDNKITEAGYAAVELPTGSFKGTDAKTYLVVAIHATTVR